MQGVSTDSTMVAFPSQAAVAFVRDVKAGVSAYFKTSRRSSKGNWQLSGEAQGNDSDGSD
jgi:hypothetical protein